MTVSQKVGDREYRIQFITLLLTHLVPNFIIALTVWIQLVLFPW